MTLRMYHNPRCSKSRATLALLREAGEEPEIIEYLKTPPDPNELDMLCKKLGLHPRQLVRFKEDRAKELGLKASHEHPRAEWLRLLVDNPLLIERPIAVKGGAARLGRSPEAVKALL